VDATHTKSFINTNQLEIESVAVHRLK